MDFSASVGILPVSERSFSQAFAEPCIRIGVQGFFLYFSLENSPGEEEKMNVIVQSKTMLVTEALRDFSAKQAQKFAKSGRKIEHVVVFLEVVKKKKNDLHAATAQFLISVPGKNIVVRERAKNMYTAIASAADHALQQLNKAKEKEFLRRTKVQVVMVPAR